MRKDITIFRDETKFAAWPAGNTARCWGNEMFFIFGCGERNLESAEPPMAPGKPMWTVLARSLDGGESWQMENHPLLSKGFKPSDADSEELMTFDGKLDFSDPDFTINFGMTGHSNPGDFSWWIYSTDRGRNWVGPYKMEIPGLENCLTMRTQYIVESKDELTIFGTCQKSYGREGRSFCGKMFSDGTFKFLGWIGEEFEENFSFYIMPQGRRRQDGTLVALCRTKWREGHGCSFHHYISQFESTDGGKTWERKPDVSGENGNNPPALTVLGDGTWVVFYGCRDASHPGIRCKYSEDEGRTWSEEINFRDDTVGWDLGYPNILTRQDGKAVVAYYYCHSKEEERYIAGAILDSEYLKMRK